MQFNFFRFEFNSYLKGTQCTTRCPIKGGKLCASQSLPGVSWSGRHQRCCHFCFIPRQTLLSFSSETLVDQN